MKLSTYTTTDNTVLALYAWKTTARIPKGCILITHGMMEHAQRYSEFAQYLCDSGYHVTAYDHRGHGKTCSDQGLDHRLGHVSQSTTWSHLVSDCNEIINTIRHQHPDLPITLFGHSMGSFIALNTVIDFPDNVTHLILSGTCYESTMGTRIGIILSRLLLAILPSHTKGLLFHILIFGGFNLRFFLTRDPADWTSRDTQKVDECRKDPYTGFCCSIYFFNVLFTGLNQLFRPDILKKIPHIPLLLMSGGDDAIAGKNLKKLYRLVTTLTRNGSHNGHPKHTLKIYPNGRHELINELNRHEIYRDVVLWLDKQ
jgi:alpha-beta hydrolase superfamily lysophospholipase